MVRFLQSELTWGERLGLAWQLAWPAVVLDFIWSFVVHVILDVKSTGVDALYLVPYLLVIAPWLVRRMFRRTYPNFRLKTMIHGAPAPMGYTESFKVMWLLSWRTSVLMLVLLLLVSMALGLVHVQLATLVPSTEEAPFFNTVGLSVFENGAALLLMPLVIPGMFAKRYQGFRVMAERGLPERR
ncbi:MAG TPA: hypothetical protein VM120_05760 [Bryobacteraceae bacterium]|nr:hypothetical protein [Bryobacteraceae bacterium]